MKNMCPYPFMGICAQTTGAVVPCCHLRKKDIDKENYNFTETDLETIFYGDKWTTLRQQFINGERPNLCSVCWEREDKNLRSPRQDALKRYTFDIETPKIKFADLKYTNECNLTCRMCSPGSSNQVDKLVSNSDSPQHLWRNKIAEFSIDKFSPRSKVDSTKKLIDNGLETLKVTGGEPFVSKYFHEVLDYAIESGAANHLKIRLTTNATKFTNALLEKLDHFKWIDYVISIDGYGKTYEYIRHPFTWQMLDRRIDQFLDFHENKKNFFARPEMLLMVYNALDYDNLNSWWESKRQRNGILGPLNVSPFVKTQGDELAVKMLPKHIKDNIKGPDNVNEYVNAYYNYEDVNSCKRLKETVEFYDKKLGRKYTDYLHADIVDFIGGL